MRRHPTRSYSGNPPGTDLDGDGDSDSWLVPLPIMECQNPGPHCASGTPQKIVGVACFDIQEVLGAPDKEIRGSFVCPGDPRFSASACGVGFGPGGECPPSTRSGPSWSGRPRLRRAPQSERIWPSAGCVRPTSVSW
ncbi:MAG: hypothetical protein ACREI8_03995 [Myxococcota bacterium]